MSKDKTKTKPAAGPLSAGETETSPPLDEEGAGNPIPPGPRGFPIVGIGASAGGLAAFEAFFSGMPKDTEPGLAFVLVQHLSPDHKSILTELVKRYTRMRVYEVEDGMKVEPNCAYIIPPGRDMAFINGTLQLLEPSAPRGQRLPIDFFFRSLAQDQRERAIGIVLSGTGSDGTLGVRAIKGEGGMVMAQDPVTTEYDGMPRSAIATGLVDYELAPAEMPVQLIAYVAHAFGRPKGAPAVPPRTENILSKVFVLIRAQTGHDFSQYKPSTVNRRIERRMAVHQIVEMEGYLKYIQQRPEEVEALFRDMLIGVTSFFRDPEAFKALEERIVPRLFAERHPDSPIRVWVPGCATGEEAYSLAILLAEHQEVLKRSFKVQLFGTDIDSRAIAQARAGLYPASIAADITPERLARFFSAEADGSTYRVHKGIRDLLVFSEQDVIKDPPFSRLDLISCRNLLIYMNADLQKRLIPLFHYALNPRGVLFLGTSETVSEFVDLFASLDRKQKIFERKDDLHGAQRPGLGRLLAHTVEEAGALPGGRKAAQPQKIPLRELTERALLQQTVAAAALVGANGDILYLHGRTGMYLEPAPGEAGVNNILRMAREGLRRELTTALHQAAAGREPVRCPNLRVRTNGQFIAANLTVSPVVHEAASEAGAPLFLVVLEEARPAEQPPALPGESPAGELPPDVDARIAALQQELKAKEEYLQTANEELETSNEELKSSNEEMQSVNEELQSTNEELETSKEELQSVNEELATVNNELQTKVADLSRANNDMNNLLAGTGIATVFVDHQLRILRFTPAATRIINLIASDIGRPVSHIVSNLAGYDRLPADTQAVLDTLIPKEADVRTVEGKWYTLRIQPYRTLDNVIEGAVITFVDVTVARKLAEQAQKTTDLLNASQRLSRVGGWEWTAEAQTMFWTEETYRIHDFTPGEIDPGNPEHIRRSLECYAPEDRPNVLAAFQRCVNEGQPYDLELPFTSAKGRRLWIRTTAQAVLESGKVIRVLGNIMDITERRQAGEALRENEERLRVALGAAPLVVFNQDRDLRYTWIHNPGPGFSAEQVIGKTDADLLPEEDAAALTALKQRVLDSGQGARQHVRTTIGGKPSVYDLSVEPLRDACGAVVGITCACMDVTGQPRKMRREAGATRTLPSGKEGEKP